MTETNTVHRLRHYCEWSGHGQGEEPAGRISIIPTFEAVLVGGEPPTPESVERSSDKSERWEVRAHSTKHAVSIKREWDRGGMQTNGKVIAKGNQIIADTKPRPLTDAERNRIREIAKMHGAETITLKSVFVMVDEAPGEEPKTRLRSERKVAEYGPDGELQRICVAEDDIDLLEWFPADPKPVEDAARA